jgi:hypothetical protein
MMLPVSFIHPLLIAADQNQLQALEHPYVHLFRSASDPVVYHYLKNPFSNKQKAAWIPYFPDIMALIFLAPLSSFDERLPENPKINRLEDTFVLWKTVCASKLLSNVQLVSGSLFLIGGVTGDNREKDFVHE